MSQRTQSTVKIPLWIPLVFLIGGATLTIAAKVIYASVQDFLARSVTTDARVITTRTLIGEQQDTTQIAYRFNHNGT